MSGEPGECCSSGHTHCEQPFSGEAVVNVECHALRATLLCPEVVGEDNGHGPPIVSLAFWDGDSPIPGQRSGQLSAPAAAYRPELARGSGATASLRRPQGAVESGAHRTGSTPGARQHCHTRERRRPSQRAGGSLGHRPGV